MLLSTWQISYAVGAYPGVIHAQQADGSSLSILKRGDEFFHQVYTTDGYPLIYNAATCNYEYAQLRGGALVRSGVVAADAARRSKAATRWLAGMDKMALEDAVLQRAKSMRMFQDSTVLMQRAPQRVTTDDILQMRNSDIPTVGDRKVLVVLVQFSDVKFRLDDAQQHYDRILNERRFTDGYGTPGSARDYYERVSAGRYHPDFVVAGPVTMPKKRDYYGENKEGGGDYTARVGEMIKYACQQLDDEVDFSEFDSDGDGQVDNVYVFYAGNGEADSNVPSSIWPHAYYLNYASGSVRLDNVYINRYATSQEINGSTGNYAGLGTFLHEFGHVLGFADHYNTSGSQSIYTPRYWDIMDAGSYNNRGYTPPYYSSFERATLGWLEPVELSVTTDSLITLPCLADTAFAYTVSVPGRSNEFFVLENRQRKDFDAYLPGHGMVVWHIDYNNDAWRRNAPNNVDDHQRVDIVEANGALPTGAASAFPGARSIRTFEFTTWSGDTLFSFADVREEDEQINFRLGGAAVGLTAPARIEVDSIYGHQARLTWSKVKNADSYRVGVILDRDTVVYEQVKDTVLHLTKLKSQTVYGVQVASRYRTYLTSAASKYFATVEPAFFERRVELLSPVALSTDRFTARWKPQESAQEYEATLYSASYDGESAQTEHFDQADGQLPEGWESGSTTYATDHYGESAPALRLNSNKQYLTLSVADTTTALGIRFWYRLPRKEASLTIQHSQDGTSWIRDTTMVSDGESHLVEVRLKEPARYVRLRYGYVYLTYLYLDDVSLIYRDWAYTPIGASVRLTDTEYTFSDLEANTRYGYSVRALQDKWSTLESMVMPVLTMSSNTTGIATLQSGAKAEVYDMQGRKVDYTTAPAGIYILREGSNTRKVLKR